MPKQKKKGGKKKSGKSKKNKEPEMTTEEAILAYRVSINEKQLEERKYHLKAALEENLRLKDRNKALLEEQEKLLKVLHKEAADFESKSRSETKTEKTEVVHAMKDKWACEKAEIAELNDIREQIKKTEQRIIDSRSEIKRWTFYRDEVLPKQQTQIRLYEQEIQDLDATYQDIQHHLQHNLHLNKRKIEDHKKKAIVVEKESAANKASTIIDRDTKREVADNLWLKDEVQMHSKAVERLRHEIQELEGRNLDVLSVLFDCHKEDLLVSPRLFMTQFEDHENLELSARLQYDLEEIRRPKPGQFILPDERKRPKSAVLKAVERKLEEANLKVQGEREQEGDAEAEQNVLVAMPFKTGEKSAPSSRASSSRAMDEDKRILSLFHYSNKVDDAFQFFAGDAPIDREETLLAERVVHSSRGGPLEFKLLNIVGKRVELEEPDPDAADILEEEKRQIKWRKEDWRVSAN